MHTSPAAAPGRPSQRAPGGRSSRRGPKTACTILLLTLALCGRDGTAVKRRPASMHRTLTHLVRTVDYRYDVLS